MRSRSFCAIASARTSNGRSQVMPTQNDPVQTAATLKAEVKNLSFYYGKVQALKSISMPIAEKQVTAIIGPSGCGKSTFLRCFNRMHDLYPGNRYEGEIVLQPDNTNTAARQIAPMEVRMRISMVLSGCRTISPS